MPKCNNAGTPFSFGGLFKLSVGGEDSGEVPQAHEQRKEEEACESNTHANEEVVRYPVCVFHHRAVPP